MHFGLAYDLRNSLARPRPFADIYADFLRQVEWADAHGFQSVSLPEHHFTEDGYLPSPLVAAAAVAARTSRMRIEIGLTLLPLKHPVQLAEDAAVVDILSNGRLDLMVGGGYVADEFAGYGISMAERGRRMEEGVQIIKRCWTEEAFSFQGRIWQLENVRMSPKPVQRPHPPLLMGGASPAAARRAARLADGFRPTNQKLFGIWWQEMVRLGKDPGPEPVRDAPRPPSNFLYVARDPRAAWERVGPYALEVNNTYARLAGNLKFSPYQHADSPDELLARGSHGVLTPAEAVDLGRRMEAADPANASLRFSPLIGGLPYDDGMACIELVASEVMPAFG